MPFLDTVISGPEAWSANETIARAIEVREGTILNVDVVEFQQMHSSSSSGIRPIRIFWYRPDPSRVTVGGRPAKFH